MLGRSVSDKIKSLDPMICPVLAMTSSLAKNYEGKFVDKNVRIQKETVKSGYRFEWQVFTPIATKYTATGGSASTLLLASTAGFRARDTVFNKTQDVIGIVTAVTDSTTLAITSIYGTWAASADDDIFLMASAHEWDSNTSDSLSKEPDNYYNILQTFREGLTVSALTMSDPQVAGPSIMERYREQKMKHALRTIEHTLLFGERAASGDTTSVTISTAKNISTTRGMWRWAPSTTISLGGAVTPETLNNVLYTQLPNTLDPSKEHDMLVGRNFIAQVNKMQQDGYLETEPASSSDGDTFGRNVTRLMLGDFRIRLHRHYSFDEGSMRGNALLFDPEDVVYMVKDASSDSGFTTWDIHERNDIDTKKNFAKSDEIVGCLGLKVWSGGANVVRVTGISY
jgi:hypothetical protein